MDGLVSKASMIRLSLHPLPASETSAFNKIRAFSTRCAGLFPFRINVSSRSRSSPLSLTTYFFTEISFAATGIAHDGRGWRSGVRGVVVARLVRAGQSARGERPRRRTYLDSGMVRPSAFAVL